MMIRLLPLPCTPQQRQRQRRAVLQNSVLQLNRRQLQLPVLLLVLFLLVAIHVVDYVGSFSLQSTPTPILLLIPPPSYQQVDSIRFCSTQRRQKRRRHLSVLHYDNKKNTNQDDDDDDDVPLVPPNNEKNILDLLLNPYQSAIIPKEISKDIYIAEGNTIAAQERTRRITIYAAIAFGGVLCAFFNGFLTELRNNPPPALPDGTALVSLVDPSSSSSSSSLDNNKQGELLLNALGFGWVYSNFLFSFIFTNKIGGIICLLTGGGAGLLAEAEYDTRRINAEKIYTELLRRRTASSTAAMNNDKGNGTSIKKSTKASNKRRSNSKEAKRINALSEVATTTTKTFIGDAVVDVGDINATDIAVAEVTKKVSTAVTDDTTPNDASATTTMEDGRGSKNLIDQMKDLYQQADTMAATQALLLNKELEDQGILPKITDASGLKVIGRDRPPPQDKS